MENYNIVYDLIEHPENFSSEEVHEILSNPEMKEIYKILCQLSTVFNAENNISEELIDEEWERLNAKPAIKPEIQKCFSGRLISSSRVASVSLIFFSSLIALAVGISVSLSVAHKKSKDSSEFSSTNVSQMISSGDTITSKVNEETEKSGPVIFEDIPLEDILKVISHYYNVSVKFRNPDTAEIHLFYKFDARKPLEDIVEQLNTFERISISIDGDTIIVE